MADQRQERTRVRLLAATEDILRTHSYARLTMERVAAESGVAKTTLYRRWPTKAALCMELYLEIAGRELHVPDTGDLATDLQSITNAVVRLQTRTAAGAAFLGLIAEAQLNPDSRGAFLAEFAERRRDVTRHVLKRAIRRGQLHPRADIDLIIDALGGAVTFRLMQGHAPLTRRFTDALVALVLHGCSPSPKPSGKRRR